jgi:ferrous iron transport protein A
MMKGKRMTLYGMEGGRRVRICNITGGKSMKRLLSDYGIRAGDSVQVKRNARFGGPVLVEREGREVALGRGIAECILVEEETA